VLLARVADGSLDEFYGVNGHRILLEPIGARLAPAAIASPFVMHSKSFLLLGALAVNGSFERRVLL